MQSLSIIKYMLMHLTDILLVYPLGVKYWKKIICSDAEIARYVLNTYGKSIEKKIVRIIHVGIHDRIQKK